MLGLLSLVASVSFSQTVSLETNNLEALNTKLSIETLSGQRVVRVVKDPSVKNFDQPTFVRIRGTEFSNGTIRVKVLSRLLKDAPEMARGFIGIAFRITSDNSMFESFYLRPTNGRVDDSVRRSHALQYFSFPDFDFDRLRRETPGKYESHADIGLNEWIDMRIEVQGSQAKLFINDSTEPALVVNDLKHGEHLSGKIGLWVDVGTEGFFKDLIVSQK